jgi:release factor glutamine methyltransferase
MTLRELLCQAANTLALHGSDDPYFEAELLLRYLLKLERAKFYVNLMGEVTEKQIRTSSALIQRRICHEPIAYITGSKEFFGIEFYVDHRVFIPRPETELLVEQALALASSRFSSSCVVADIGTGCGAIAIALALNLPQAEVYATDVSTEAIEVIAINCHKHGVGGRVHIVKGDLLHPLTEPFDLIIANLPYIKDSDIAGLSAEIKLFEPLCALAGGEDGLHWIRRLLYQVDGKVRQGGAILLELSPGQGEAVLHVAKGLLPEAKAKLMSDLSGHERAAIIEFV